MKILVIEDGLENQELAKAQLVGHDLTIVDNFTDAINQLFPECDKFNDIIEPEIGRFDVVLSDMNIPLGSSRLKNNLRYAFILNEKKDVMPYGAIICLVAIRNKIKKVAIVSSGDHHNDGIAAALCMASFSINWNQKDSPFKFRIRAEKNFAQALEDLIVR